MDYGYIRMKEGFMKKVLTSDIIFQEAVNFCKRMNESSIPGLVGITDGKAIGTYIEHAFVEFLRESYSFARGNSSRGIDLPGEAINCDIKVTSINRPQSSSPYQSAAQKIFGLHHNLLVLVYDRNKDSQKPLRFLNVTFVPGEETGDFMVTGGLLEILREGGNKEGIISFLKGRRLPGDDSQYSLWADKILKGKIRQGYLTLTDALQWRLQYNRVISLDNSIRGIRNYDFNKKE